MASFDPIARSLARPKSLRAAVVAKCWECVGGDAAPAPRQRIGACAVMRCPLRPHCPYRQHAEAECDGDEP
jgi:hypothetical protein